MTTITASVRRLPESPTERMAQLERQVADLKFDRMRLRNELQRCTEALEAVAPLLDQRMAAGVRNIAAGAREAL